MLDFSQFDTGSEEDLLCGYFAKSYNLPGNAVKITGQRFLEKNQVVLSLDVRLGSSPTRGSETFTRLDLGTLFAGLDEIKMGAGGLPAFGEFAAYFRKEYHIPTDRLEITRIGNAYVIVARTDSLLFVGRKTFYIR